MSGQGWAAVGQAAGTIVGTAMQGRYNAKAQARSHRHTEKMAKNAHQWEVEDLKAAGLNPILSATGKGASASGSASASIGQPDIGAAVTTALSAMRLESEIKNIDANTQKVATETKGLEAQLPKKETFGNIWDYPKMLMEKYKTTGKETSQPKAYKKFRSFTEKSAKDIKNWYEKKYDQIKGFLGFD